MRLVYFPLSVLVFVLLFTKIWNLSDNKSSQPIIFGIELGAHLNESIVSARTSQIFVDRILDWHQIFCKGIYQGLFELRTFSDSICRTEETFY